MIMRVTLATLACLFMGRREVNAALSVRSSSLSTIKKIESRVAALQRTYSTALGQSCLDQAATATGSSSYDLWDEIPILANNPRQINTQVAQLSGLVSSIQGDDDFFSNFIEEISTDLLSADMNNALLTQLTNLSDVTALQNQIKSLQTGLKSMTPKKIVGSFQEVIESAQLLTASVLDRFNGTSVRQIRETIVRTVAVALIVVALLEYALSIYFVCSIEFLQSTLQFPIFTLLELVGYTIGFIACLITLVALCVWLGLHPNIDVGIGCSLFQFGNAATTLDCQFRNLVAVSGTTFTQGLNLLNEMPTEQQVRRNNTFWDAYQIIFQQVLEQCPRVYPEP